MYGEVVGVGAVTGWEGSKWSLGGSDGGGAAVLNAGGGVWEEGEGVVDLELEIEVDGVCEAAAVGARVEVMIFRRDERGPACWMPEVVAAAAAAAAASDWRGRVEAAEVWYGAGADPFSLHTGTKP